MRMEKLMESKAVIARKCDDTALPSKIDPKSTTWKDCDLHFRKARKAIDKTDISCLIIGAGSVLDIAGSRLPYPAFGSVENDFNLIGQDFSAIGEDLKQILNSLNSQLSHIKG